MDTPTKQKIIDLQNEGVGYKRIADQLGVSLNTVKSFCRSKGLTGNRTNWNAKLVLEAAEVTQIKKSEMDYRLSKMMVDYLYESGVINKRDRDKAINRLLRVY
ncbi:hypothetical protein [Lactococcus garvieae]|uniref:hypothetical protein n=1 Tax=Lactococcus garvieae TaxID=1363 RepID=UPI00254B6C30|nr:hypothetical protein [Lactococcus garvieae]